MSRAVGKEQCHELNDVLRKSRLSRFLNPIHVVSKYRSKIRPTILNLQYAVLTILRNFLDIKKSLRNRNGILKIYLPVRVQKTNLVTLSLKEPPVINIFQQLEVKQYFCPQFDVLKNYQIYWSINDDCPKTEPRI